MRARETDRGVSTTLGYVLTLSITAVLVSVLLVGTGQYVDDQRGQVAERELSVLSERVAARTADADRMVRGGGGATDVRVSVDLPRTVAGTPYRIEVSEPSVTTPRTHDITLTTGPEGESVSVRIRTGVDVESASLAGGSVVVVYDPTADSLSFESGDDVSAAVASPTAFAAAPGGGA
jgi:hypothetical protein